jgi:hypothetical protein
MIFDLLFYLSVVFIAYLLTEYSHIFNTNTFIFIIAFYIVFLVFGVYDEIESLKKDIELIYRMLRRCVCD